MFAFDEVIIIESTYGEVLVCTHGFLDGLIVGIDKGIRMTYLFGSSYGSYYGWIDGSLLD